MVPMTSVLVVARSHPGIAELSHVTGTLSAFLDCSSTLPLARACARGSVSLLQRVWEISKTPETEIDAWCQPTNTWCPSRLLWTNSFYYQDQFAKGMIAACNGGHLSTVQWLLDQFAGCVVPVEAVEAAARQGQRGVLQLLLDAYNEYKQRTRPGAKALGDKPHQVKFWESNALLAAASNGHGDLAVWMFTDVFNGFYMHSNEEVMDELARHGDFASVRRLAAEGWQLPRLDFAAEGGDAAMVQWLLDQGRDAGKQWALQRAAENGHLEIVKMLASEDFVSLDGQAFCGAAAHGHLETVQWLKEQNLGWSSASKAMDLAAGNGHLEIVQYLHADCSANCTSTTMRNAASNGHLHVVQWLHEQFVNDPMVDLFELGLKKESTTIMDEAAAHGHLYVLKYLHHVARAMEGTPGKTAPTCTPAAIHLAAAGGHVDVMAWLHAHDWAEPSVDVMDVAAANGHLQVVKWLHEHTAACCSSAAMDGAARNGFLAVLQWLHEHRTEGCTTNALDDAATMGHLDVTQWLLENREEGCTSKALDGAASNDHFDVVLYLMSKRPELRSSAQKFIANRYISAWMAGTLSTQATTGRGQ